MMDLTEEKNTDIKFCLQNIPMTSINLTNTVFLKLQMYSVKHNVPKNFLRYTYVH